MYVGDPTRSTHVRWRLEGDRLSRAPVSHCPAVIKLFDEVISNAIDESFRLNHRAASGDGKFVIKVVIDGDEITVADNGRGIPLDPMDDDPSVTQAEIAMSELRSGTNFEVKDWASIGAHGMGVTLVNLLSRKFKAYIVNKGRVLNFAATDGETTSSVLKSARDGEESGTRISYSTNWKHFSGVELLDENHSDLIQRRVIDLAAALPFIQFKFDGKVVGTRDFKSYVQMVSPVCSFEHFIGEHVRLAVTTSEEPEQISFVNGIDTHEGGQHVDYFRNRIGDLVSERLNKRYKYGLKPQDVKNRLCFIFITNSIFNPKFKGQTKEYLSSKVSEWSERVFEGFDFEKFSRKVADNEELMGPIVEFFRLKQQVREIEDEKRERKKIKKIKVAEHMRASNDDRSKTILFITEGESAIGQLGNVRDAKIHGGFPLRGKPINVTGRSNLERLENLEFKKLTGIIGLQLGEEPEDLDYGTLALMADADHDGNSIMGLLINIFSLWPTLFKKGIVKLCLSPVIKWEKGKQKQIYYTMAEYAEDRKAGKVPDGATMTYLKGLGSLSTTEYSEMIRNPRMVTIQHDVNWADSLSLVFGESADRRKTWLSSD